MEVFGTDNSSPKQALLSYVNNNVIGGEAQFRGPFGQRRGEFLSYWSGRGWGQLHQAGDGLSAGVGVYV